MNVANKSLVREIKEAALDKVINQEAEDVSTGPRLEREHESAAVEALKTIYDFGPENQPPEVKDKLGFYGGIHAPMGIYEKADLELHNLDINNVLRIGSNGKNYRHFTFQDLWYRVQGDAMARGNITRGKMGKALQWVNTQFQHRTITTDHMGDGGPAPKTGLRRLIPW